MKERAGAEPTLKEQQLLERCQQYERQLQAQANQLAECKALIEAQGEELERLKGIITHLKGRKGCPQMKPSRLEKEKPRSE